MALTLRVTDIEQLQAQRIGYMAVSLTEYDSDLEPEIAEGSVLEIGGAVYEAAADEPITGWGGIGNSNDVYILIDAGTLGAVFTLVAPTWSTTKQGWYDGLDRYVAKLYKDAGGDYTDKGLLQGGPEIRNAAVGADAIRTSQIQDAVITNAKIADLAVTNEKLSQSFDAEQTQPIGATSAWVIPAGWYWLWGVANVNIEVFLVAAWRSVGVGPLFACCDGTNVRAYNTAGGGRDLIYRKLV